MDVKTITIHYLQSNGFDGLFADGECACKLDDLFPCSSEGVERCKPGYLQAEAEADSDFDFFIGAEKPEISTSENGNENINIRNL